MTTDLGIPGWTYRVTSTGNYVTVAGEREDTPAALPLITADGLIEAEAVQNLRDMALAWDHTRRRSWGRR